MSAIVVTPAERRRTSAGSRPLSGCVISDVPSRSDVEREVNPVKIQAYQTGANFAERHPAQAQQRRSAACRIPPLSCSFGRRRPTRRCSGTPNAKFHTPLNIGMAVVRPRGDRYVESCPAAATPLAVMTTRSRMQVLILFVDGFRGRILKARGPCGRLRPPKGNQSLGPGLSHRARSCRPAL